MSDLFIDRDSYYLFKYPYDQVMDWFLSGNCRSFVSCFAFFSTSTSTCSSSNQVSNQSVSLSIAMCLFSTYVLTYICFNNLRLIVIFRPAAWEARRSSTQTDRGYALEWQLLTSQLLLLCFIHEYIEVSANLMTIPGIHRFYWV